MKQGTGDSIKVFVRVRPFNEKEKASESCLKVDGQSIQMKQMKDNDPDHRFSFDHIFQGNSTQEEVYNSVGYEVVESAFEGFNGTVFAYGQTSSGKTHTCIGPDYVDKEKRGILPRMVGHIYDKIKQGPSYIEFRIKVSMVEIYMEKIKDLLDTSKSDLRIREKAGKGIYIQDVTEEYVASEEETISFIKKGIANRSVGQTLMNDTSSRSHMAFIITLYQNNLKDASAKSGRIILVDLAGSEKISKTGAEGKLLDEAKQINKSLLALGNVINALTEQRINHIPYRDSKLTRLLQESLGGNSKTNLIINVSPSELNEPETLSSLRFGYRAKEIKNKPKVNREYTVAELLLLLEKAEKKIQELELVISEMSVKKTKNMKKKGSQIYVENLLDSDHPIIETDLAEPNELTKKEIEKIKQSAEKRLKPHYDSEYQEESDEETSRVSSSAKKLKPLLSLENQSEGEDMNKKLAEEKEILAEEIQMLNVEKIEISREYDILQEKYEITSRENNSSKSKILYLQKENEKLLEKLVIETCLLQEDQVRVQELEDKIKMYEERILNIAALQEKESSISKIFGKKSDLAIETKSIADLVKNNKIKNGETGIIDLEEQIEEKVKLSQQKDSRIQELENRNKQLEDEIGLYKHLEPVKEAFISDRLKFSEERERVYKDLENRIEKVLELEERLDEEGEKRKYFEELIKSEESEKNRKILLLQQHLNEVSENYYVLKGQQSSWSKDNQRAESKIQTKNKKIFALEKEVMNLKEQIESLKIVIEDLEENPKEESVLDLDLSDNNEQFADNGRKSNIVKVVRSSNFSGPELNE